MNKLTTADAFNILRDRLTDKNPYFLARIGGSDTDALANYFSIGMHDTSFSAHLKKYLPLCKRLNGFYSFRNEVDDYRAYLDVIDSCYRRSDFLMVIGKKLQHSFFPECLNQNQEAEVQARIKILRRSISDLKTYVDSISSYHNIQFSSYTFAGRLLKDKYTLFNLFAEILPGRRVLVVCPFEMSIRQNRVNRHSFFKGEYNYPEFEPDYINVPITYEGLSRDQYPHEAWNETLSYLINEIRSREFDVALLSCGSYAMPIGRDICETLGKKAIYVGGLLQLFFGIKGRRYESQFFQTQLNLDAMIDPIEKRDFAEAISAHQNSPTEGFGAYF